MSRSVIDVHRDHLESHRFVQEYDSGFAYLRDQLGFSESKIADAYRDIGMEHMFRIHTDRPRRFLILQKNPNLTLDWVSDSLHGPHEHLSDWKGDSLARNIAHSRTTVANYLEESGALKLKVILQSLADVFDEVNYGFESALDQREFEQYLKTDIGSEYSNDDESDTISSDDGFFGDFAYTNAMKFQGPRDQVTFEEDDQEWLRDELAAINPQVILSLGNEAINSLKSLGFERTEYSGPFNNNEGKIYRYAGSDSRLEGLFVLRLYHLQARTANPHEITHASLSTIKSNI